MKGGRGLLGGLLVLALICVVPAVSAAQDQGSTETTTTTTTTTPSDPGTPPAPSESPAPSDGSSQTGASSVGAAAGAPTEPRDGPRTDDRVIGDRSPADAPTGGASGGAHKSSSTTVTMGDYFFRPSTVTISVGDIVTWRNDGHEPHTATADDGSFDTGTVPAGGKASHMFTSPGTYTYVCTIHPNMHGTIRVAGSGGGASGSDSSSTSGPSEAQAVNSPNAAGDKNTLPMSGMPVAPLTLAGLALLGSGLVVRRSMRRLIGQQLSLF